MRSAVAVGLVLQSSGALGAECSAGYKLKKVLTGLTCTTADATDAAACNTDCCELDDKTCGGLLATCSGSKYKVGVGYKATKADKEAWAAITADKTSPEAACCTAKAKCNSKAYTCRAGYKYATNLNVDCPSDFASCADKTAACCVKDAATCGGLASAPTCDAGTQVGTDDEWKATKIEKPADAASQKSACCGALPTCESKLYSCPAGQKRRKSASPPVVCSGLAPSSCASTTCCEAESDASKTTCASMTGVSCTADKYSPASLNSRPATAANKNDQCCTAKATCAVAKCPSGYKKKPNVDKLTCDGDAASCIAANAPCCMKDDKKCGGLTGSITCAVGFFDESTTWTSKTTQATKDAWNDKPATVATAAKDCCTAKAMCSAGQPEGATTTPAAIVAATTVTPAAPMRLFSDHKAAIKKEKKNDFGMNAAWLAVGGFAGMSVLMMVQKLRAGFRYSSLDLAEE